MHVNNLLAYQSVRNEGARIGVISSPPFRRKLFAFEMIEEFVLARPDREALADAAIELTAEFRNSSPGKVATISGKLRKPVILPTPKDNIIRINVAAGQIAPRITPAQASQDARNFRRGEKPTHDAKCRQRAGEFRDDEHGNVGRPAPGKTVPGAFAVRVRSH